MAEEGRRDTLLNGGDSDLLLFLRLKGGLDLICPLRYFGTSKTFTLKLFSTFCYFSLIWHVLLRSVKIGLMDRVMLLKLISL